METENAWKSRIVEEYKQLKERCNKLNRCSTKRKQNGICHLRLRAARIGTEISPE